MVAPLWSTAAMLVVMMASSVLYAAEPRSSVIELHDGDRVVFVGDTLIERDAGFGFTEERLTSLLPERNLTFRNLGWSADTPLGQSRASFDWSKRPDEWLRQLAAQITATQPTVLILGYGMANSFDGPAGISGFTNALRQLLDMVRTHSNGKSPRLVFLSPLRHQPMPPPFPDPTPHNRQLGLYVTALEQFAAAEGAPFVSLFGHPSLQQKPGSSLPLLYDNGIHLNEHGYRVLAAALAGSMIDRQSRWKLHASIAQNQSLEAGGAEVRRLDSPTAALTFECRVNCLPLSRGSNQGHDPAQKGAPAEGLIRISGLKSGHYQLRVDGVDTTVASASEWAAGIALDLAPDANQAEELRSAILQKNELFFHRWRPQNQTYLFGFRKHEQGQNAGEIPRFDPLVAEQESRIAKLRQPTNHKLELIAVAKPTAAPKLAKSAAAISASAKSSLTARTSDQAKLPATASTQPLPKFEVAPGFEINLYAENPFLAKPIQMNFDTRGRLWVASSSIYPQIQPGQIADDKILVLEDTNHDGKAETSTVFADGLLIPTGVEPGDGGVYVGQSTQLLHFKDTDGDGRADQRRVALSSFGTEDTHHILHTLRWGHDGQLYFNQSIYIHSHLETPQGVVRLNSGGLFQLRTANQQLEVFLRGFCNPWGHHFDRYGQSFVTDGAGFQGLSLGVPGAMYFTYAGARRLLDSVSPGSYPKFCGLEFVESPHFPDDFQGNAITCDFRAHRIARFGVDEKDSSYLTRELPDLVRTTEVAFRPIDVKFGPDGALYIADWSNPIIQHGEVDFRDPRRDHERGRIWRVSAKQRPLVAPRDLTGAGNSELLALLDSPNGWTRQQARRVLAERGPSIAKDLRRWTASLADERLRLEGLWLWQGLDQPQPALLRQVLEAKDHRVRAAATRALGYWQPHIKTSLDWLAARVADPHPRVRLEALRALARVPSARAAELALSVLDQPLDAFLDYGLWLTMNDLAKLWIQALESGAWNPVGKEKQFEFALRAIDPSVAAGVLSRMLGDRPLPRDGSGPGIDLMGQAGSPADLGRLLSQTLNQGFDPQAAARSLAALVQAARTRKVMPADALNGIGRLIESGDAKIRVEAIRLAGLWKQTNLANSITAIARNPQSASADRDAAILSLGELAATETLAKLANEASDAAVRQRAVLALAQADLKSATGPALQWLGEISNENEAASFWRSWLGIRGAGTVLAGAWPAAGISVAARTAGLRIAREGTRQEAELLAVLSSGSGVATQLSADQLLKLAASALASGDPHRGEQVYRRKELGCVLCHAVGGAGGRVGPDLTSIGASAQADYLLESLVDPNGKIKEGYHSTIIETDDGTEISGVLVRETTDRFIVRDAANKEIEVPKARIKNKRNGASLMPSGLLEALSETERADLIRFLAALGKPGDFDASKSGTARLWRLRGASHDLEQFGEDRVIQSALSDSAWTPVLALTNGRLPSGEFAETRARLRYTSLIGFYLAAEFSVAKSGPVDFAFEVPAATPIWIDNQPVQAGSKPSLVAGKHRLILKIDARAAFDHIRVSAAEAVFLTE